MFGDDPGSSERCDNGEASGDKARHVHRGLGDSQDRPSRDLPTSQQARITKTGDNVTINLW
jgi:hypothetical protein